MAIFLLHTAASYYYISQQEITGDEPDYIEYAKRWLHGHPERVPLLDDSKSPIVVIAWVPRIVRQLINPKYQLHDYGKKDQLEGRYMMIFFSLLAAIYVYWWCKDLYGKKGWILPLVLLLFDPLFLAYSTLIISDLATGTMLVCVLYHYRKFLLSSSRKQYYLTALYAVLAVITKPSLLFLIILLPIIYLVHFSILEKGKKLITKTNVLNTLLFFALIILGINIVYYFHKTCIPLNNYSFESKAFQSLQRSLSFLWMPVPIPQTFIQAIDLLKAHSEIGAGVPGKSTTNGVYLFGVLKLKEGFWYYYLVQLFYKLPIGTMLLFLTSAFLFIKNFKAKSFAASYQYLVIPIIFYWFILSFGNQFQTGIRHFLVVYPLMFIGLGYLFSKLKNAALSYKIATGAAIVYVFVTVAIYYPNLIPYTNEFITDKKTVYKKILDSSIDYALGKKVVFEYISKHPEYKMATVTPSAGKYAVLMIEALNIYYRNENKYKWYLAFEPKDHYKYTVLLYDITEQDLKNADFRKTDIIIKDR